MMSLQAKLPPVIASEATSRHCERSEAIRVASSVCFVATLLAMTAPRNDKELPPAMTMSTTCNDG